MDSDAGGFCRALHPKLVGALALHCGDRLLADELAQETLARVWERWATVRDLDAPGAWAFRVAFNLAASRFRRNAAERRAHRRLGLPSSVAPAVDSAEILAVREAVAALPDRQRAAVVLRYFVDLPVAQVAELLGCEPGTVKSLTSHARAQLRRHLDIDDKDEDDEEREYA